MEEPGPGHHTSTDDDELDEAAETGRHRDEGSVDISSHFSEGVWTAKSRTGGDGDPDATDASDPTLGQHRVPNRHRSEIEAQS